jgi:hypothetical protein
MRYLAICILSLTALLRSAGTSARAEEIVPAANPPALVESVAPAQDHDGALALMLSAALIALQLRRRQKSLRMPRAFLG